MVALELRSCSAKLSLLRFLGLRGKGENGLNFNWIVGLSGFVE